MSVCIAAIYGEGGPDSGIVAVSDWQLTDTHTGRKSFGIKFFDLTKRIIVLGVDDMTLFGTLIEEMLRRIRLNPDISVKDAAELFIDVERDWRKEYIERHVLCKFGLTWDEYQERLVVNGWPDSFIHEVTKAIGTTEVPYSTDVIFAGVDADLRSHIFRITPQSKDNCTPDGYAIIGQGDSIAKAEFESFIASDTLERVMYLTFIAKKRSQAISSVGDETSILVIDHKHGARYINGEIMAALEKEYKVLERQRGIYEKKSFKRAEAVIKSYGEDIAAKG